MSDVQIQYVEDGQIKNASLDLFSSRLQDGENILWSHEEKKGLIRKTVVSTWAITNYRVFIFNEEVQKMRSFMLMRDIDDVVVMNSHRSSQSIGYGSYRGVAVRYSNTKSKTIGDVSFLNNGVKVITFGQIADPSGVAKMVKSIRKTMYSIKDIEKIQKQNEKETKEQNEKCPSCGLKNLKSALFCNQCGTKIRVPCSQCKNPNPVGSSFCNKCGFTLQ